MLYDPRIDDQLDERLRAGLAQGWALVDGAGWLLAPDALAGGSVSLVDRELVAALRCGCGRRDVRPIGHAIVGWFHHGAEGDVAVACPAGHVTTWTWDAVAPGGVERALGALRLLGLELSLGQAARTHVFSSGPSPSDPLYTRDLRVRTFASGSLTLTRRLSFVTNHPEREMDWAPSCSAAIELSGIPGQGGPLVLEQRDTDLEAVRVRCVDPDALPAAADEERLLDAWRRAGGR